MEGDGVLLPGVDPTIGEIVLATLRSNPQAPIAEVAVALLEGAPDRSLGVECVSALLELVLCREKGHVYWMGQTGQSILVGARRSAAKEALLFGANVWPLPALMAGAPQVVSIDTAKHGRVPVYAACAGLEGTVLRQSEVIALGNLLVKAFGAKVIEDRQGPEVLRNAFVEANMAARASQRAAVMDRVERVTIEAPTRAGHARVLMAEAVPGSAQVGQRLCPEGMKHRVFVVESRTSDSYVMLVGEERTTSHEAATWYAAEELGAVWGFTTDAAVPVFSSEVEA